MNDELFAILRSTVPRVPAPLVSPLTSASRCAGVNEFSVLAFSASTYCAANIVLGYAEAKVRRCTNALAKVKLFLEWDWSGAEKEAERAKELNS